MLVVLGSARFKVETMSTRIYLELSSGNMEFAIAATVIMLVLAGAALLAVHALAPGRKWS
jgi:ABC-type sulfate transport system permease component